MSSLFTLLEKIKAKPGLYIGKAAIGDLRTFILGDRHARSGRFCVKTVWEIEPIEFAGAIAFGGSELEVNRFRKIGAFAPGCAVQSL
jgi:hypothetical protein